MTVFAVGVLVGLTLGLAITAVVARAMWSRIEAIAVIRSYAQGVKHERDGLVVINPDEQPVPIAFLRGMRRSAR